MTVHTLKSWSHFFDAIAAGTKLHDLRCKKDRDFKVGDILKLQRYDQWYGKYTGEEVVVEVTYITSNDTPCAYSSSALDRDYAILSIKLVPQEVNIKNCTFESLGSVLSPDWFKINSDKRN